jgi:hypothetical protein
MTFLVQNVGSLQHEQVGRLLNSHRFHRNNAAAGLGHEAWDLAFLFGSPLYIQKYSRSFSLLMIFAYAVEITGNRPNGYRLIYPEAWMGYIYFHSRSFFAATSQTLLYQSVEPG